MLIHALRDYYEILAKAEKVLPEGYSHVNIHYLVSLSEDGRVDRITDWRNREEVNVGKKGIKKEVLTPRNEIMPQRTEKPGIEANILEHRPLYIFGLNLENNGELTPDDRTDKARKSHEAFVKANLAFLEGMDTPLVCAFRQFLTGWKPEEETENVHLKGLGKDYGKSGFTFCLAGHPDSPLHEEPLIKERWEEWNRKMGETASDTYVTQCAVSGHKDSIARIHNKVKGISGGLATGSVLVGFNNPSENSYGNEQSYNSSISVSVMEKYTEALNYLLGSGRHKILLDDVTVVFWAMDAGEACEDLLMAMLCGKSDKMDGEQTQRMLKSLAEDGKKGKLTRERLESLQAIDPDTTFYMVGIKPNSSRLAVKFIYRRQYADVLWNTVRFQEDLKMGEELRPISLARIKMELTSPKSKNETINPAVTAKLFEAVLYGGRLPESLLQTAVRRVKTDADSKVNEVRAGIIKACIHRNYKKGEFGVALDRENQTPAYLCGRLFAVLEKLQQDASNNSLNRTIKDAYFASASSKPAIVFPKLLRLAQNHLNKVKSPGFYNKLIGEIIEPLAGEFPETLLLVDQGRFIIGYYQQYQSFFTRKAQPDGDFNLENTDAE